MTAYCKAYYVEDLYTDTRGFKLAQASAASQTGADAFAALTANRGGQADSVTDVNASASRDRFFSGSAQTLSGESAFSLRVRTQITGVTPYCENYYVESKYTPTRRVSNTRSSATARGVATFTASGQSHELSESSAVANAIFLFSASADSTTDSQADAQKILQALAVADEVSGASASGGFVARANATVNERSGALASGNFIAAGIAQADEVSGFIPAGDFLWAKQADTPGNWRTFRANGQLR